MLTLPGEIMIGPPGLPKAGRRSLADAPERPARRRGRLAPLKWLAALYVAGVFAHFSHHMAFGLPAGSDASLVEALASAPVSLAWPADLVGTLIRLD